MHYIPTWILWGHLGAEFKLVFPSSPAVANVVYTSNDHDANVSSRSPLVCAFNAGVLIYLPCTKLRAHTQESCRVTHSSDLQIMSNGRSSAASRCSPSGSSSTWLTLLRSGVEGTAAGGGYPL